MVAPQGVARLIKDFRKNGNIDYTDIGQENYFTSVGVVVCSPGGGGVLIFFSYVGSGPASTVHPKKISGIPSTPKLFEILATQKISPILYLGLKKRL